MGSKTGGREAKRAAAAAGARQQQSPATSAVTHTLVHQTGCSYESERRRAKARLLSSRERERERNCLLSLVSGIWMMMRVREVKLKNVCSSQMNVCFDENTPFAWTSCWGSLALAPRESTTRCCRRCCCCCDWHLMHQNQVGEQEEEEGERERERESEGRREQAQEEQRKREAGNVMKRRDYLWIVWLASARE